MNFIEHAKGLTRNPLGIIALFVSLIYGFACLVLSTSISNLKETSERVPLIWFIIVFPIIILIGFIFLVTKHHGKLYSPSDYGNPESFLKTIEGAKKFESVQIDVQKPGKEAVEKISDLVKKVEDSNLNKGFFSDATKENVKMANAFFRLFMDWINKNDYRKYFKEISFGVQAPEYFILNLNLDKEHLKSSSTTSKETIIIRITHDNNNVLNLIGIGKDIIENNAAGFSEKITNHVKKMMIIRLKENLIN